jgi:hypothetical protein
MCETKHWLRKKFQKRVFALVTLNKVFVDKQFYPQAQKRCYNLSTKSSWEKGQQIRHLILWRGKYNLPLKFKNLHILFS